MTLTQCSPSFCKLTRKGGKEPSLSLSLSRVSAADATPAASQTHNEWRDVRAPAEEAHEGQPDEGTQGKPAKQQLS